MYLINLYNILLRIYTITFNRLKAFYLQGYIKKKQVEHAGLSRSTHSINIGIALQPSRQPGVKLYRSQAQGFSRALRGSEYARVFRLLRMSQLKMLIELWRVSDKSAIFSLAASPRCFRL